MKIHLDPPAQSTYNFESSPYQNRYQGRYSRRYRIKDTIPNVAGASNQVQANSTAAAATL
jgi:hypothetical protein